MWVKLKISHGQNLNNIIYNKIYNNYNKINTLFYYIPKM